MERSERRGNELTVKWRRSKKEGKWKDQKEEGNGLKSK
jgi:hypothetical protein